MAFRRFLFLTAAATALAASAIAQTNPNSLAARQWRQQHERAIMDDFFSLLSLPNIARDKEDIRRNADALVTMMQKRGLAPKLVTVPGANPVVYGEIKTPGATRTIVFYAHYDGQPLDEKEWVTPPFKPVLRNKPLDQDGVVIPLPPAGTPFDPESRIYARSAADDKAAIVAILSAVDAIKAQGLKMKANIKFAFEGEEEAGSANLEKIIAANKELFSGDVWLMCDGPVHQSRRQLIVFGARGGAGLDITIYGAKSELHSGHYGNWTLNPAMMLARLLASMKDDNGRVLIPGFYDDVAPLSATEKKAIADSPPMDADLMKEFWLGSTEGAPAKLNELITLPAFNIRGMASSRVGAGASNVIPSTATASIDIRLVKGMDPKKTANQVIEFVRRQGYFIVDSDPSAEVRMAHPKIAKITARAGSEAERTSMDLPISQEIIRVVESARGETVKLPNMGGGLPLDAVVKPLNVPVVVVPIGNHDNNQHSFNENLRVKNLWDGIELMTALITM